MSRLQFYLASRKMLFMATKRSKSVARKLHAKPKKIAGRGRKPELPVLSPSDPHYFAKLGERGGEQTLAKNGPAFFQYIARLSHEARRRNKIKRQNDARGLPTVYE
jgi:hypothetical protein